MVSDMQWMRTEALTMLPETISLKRSVLSVLTMHWFTRCSSGCRQPQPSRVRCLRSFCSYRI